MVPLVEQLRQQPYAQGDIHRLRELAKLTQLYIADTVAQLLRKAPTSLAHLDALMKATIQLQDVDLVTLNHDLVLEASLTETGVVYADGFEQTEEDVRLWQDDWSHSRVRLLKLHGSLDWWAYTLPLHQWRGWVVGRYTGNDAIHPSRADVEAYPHDLRPVFLTGTFSKILDYETWIFPDQHLRFAEGLRDANRVVVIGYGFGDKAINTRLIAWLARARTNRLVVCHGEPASLESGARGAIQGKWDPWLAHEQLIVIPKWVGDLTTEDLLSA